MTPTPRKAPVDQPMFDLDVPGTATAPATGPATRPTVAPATASGSAPAPPEEPAAAEPVALSVGALFAQVDRALRRVLAGPVWVTGEIRSVRQVASGHCYLELVDPAHARDSAGPVLRVACFGTHWRPLRRSLDRLGLQLEPGQVVRVRGEVRTYARQSALNLVITELDTEALVGRVAAARARLVAALVEEGLYDANRSLAFPSLPLRIGLVASPGTEGYRDFLGQLEASGMAFRVLVAPAVVQGAAAPRAIAAALGRVERRGCDVAVLVRGGGSRADLAPYDAERVARAVATATVPVLTGIGHTGDRSVVDEVAHRSFVTPTECGAHLAGLARTHWVSVAERAQRLAQVTREVAMAEDAARLRARHRVATGARAQVARHRDRVVHRTGTLEMVARSRTAGQHQSLVTRAERLVRSARTEVDRRSAAHVVAARRLAPRPARRLASEEARTAEWRRLLDAFDVRRQLERGYSITRDGEGRVVRSTGAVGPGTQLVTQVADGAVRSVVTDDDHDEGSR